MFYIIHVFIYFYIKIRSDIGYYVIALKNLNKNILNVISTSGNHANVQEVDNHDLRVSLLCGHIKEKKMAKEVLKRDLYYHRDISYYNIYRMVFNSSAILFDNFYAYTHRKAKLKKSYEDYIEEIYVSLQRLLEYANECLDLNNKIYGNNDYEKFNRHPFS